MKLLVNSSVLFLSGHLKPPSMYVDVTKEVWQKEFILSCGCRIVFSEQTQSDQKFSSVNNLPLRNIIQKVDKCIISLTVCNVSSKRLSIQ